MHMFIILRGANDRLARFCSDVMAQYSDWKAPNGRVYKVRWMLRPIQIYDMVFPEHDYERVLATLNPYQFNYTGLNIPIQVLRKFLRLKPIQKAVKPNNAIDLNFVQRVGIGIKHDLFDGTDSELL